MHSRPITSSGWAKLAQDRAGQSENIAFPTRYRGFFHFQLVVTHFFKKKKIQGKNQIHP
jgi:hypothetical protein